jgi:hypothetical protein
MGKELHALDGHTDHQAYVRAIQEFADSLIYRTK